MNEHVESPTPPTKNSRQPGMEELVEDVFGLNVRGLKTIKDMFVRPAKVFGAARDPLWRREYTPSIRLVFSLLALAAVLQFLWASEDSLIYAQVLADVVDSGEFQDQETAELFAKRIVDVFVAIYPVIYILCQVSMASILRVWGTGTTWATRVRLWCLAITPSSTIGILLLVLMYLIPSWEAFLLGTGGIVGSILFDGITAYRGGVARPNMWGAIWRAGLLAVFSILAIVIASVIGIVIAPIFIAITSGG